MKEVKVAVNALKEIVQKNRLQFIEDYNKAKEDYKEHARIELQKAIDKLESGSVDPIYIMIAAPEDHILEYDRILKMLQLSEDDSVVLSQNEFDRYVMNNFDFVKTLRNTTMSYTNAKGH